MTATLRYHDGSGAVFNSPEEALAQGRHDLSFPQHLTPVAIIDGDVSRHLISRQTLIGGTRAMANEWDAGIGRILEQTFEPCECHLCEFQREAPALTHEDRGVLEQMLLARVTLERDLTPEEREELVRLVGGARQMAQRLREARAGGMPPIAGGAVPAAGFTIRWGAVALTAATAKSIAGTVSSANTPVDFAEASVSCDAASGNLLIEATYGTNASAGTSTAFTPLQFRGRTQTIAATGTVNYTAEPTVLTVIKSWRYPMPTGPHLLQSPLGRELNSIVTAATSGKFAGLRLTSSVAGNTDGYAEIEE